MEITLKDLKEALEHSWSADTAFNRKRWSAENPAKDHCWASSMLVKKYFGGEMKVAILEDENSHWWNVLPDGTEVDLTKSQFPKDFVCPPGEIADGRAAFRNPWNYKRFKILEERVEEFLKNKRRVKCKYIG